MPNFFWGLINLLWNYFWQYFWLFFAEPCLLAGLSIEFDRGQWTEEGIAASRAKIANQQAIQERNVV
jgi:hypothetical protein